MSTQYLKIKQPLKAYNEPNTNSAVVATLAGEIHELLEVKSNFPSSDTDYAKVKDSTAGEVWICIRWKENTYASIVTSQEDNAPDFSTDPDAIEESKLVELLPHFNEYTYDLHEANYPFELDGINVPQGPPSSNNCCTFVEAITVKAWQDSVSNFKWTNSKHGQMMIFSDEDFFSPITCLVESNMAMAVDDDANPHKWTVIQGWRSKWSGGHTFIILDHHKETDRVLTLESNKAFKLNGVGFRMIGNFRDVNKPSSDWWSDSSLWTWEKIKATYAVRKQCVLKVKNISWV